jgi:predicted anti-sigma-YlaC factor YlaD
MGPGYRILAAAMLAMLAAGCSVKRYAINKLGDSLAKSGTVFASDNDPELVRDAVPFSLKLIESLLEESPRHRGLLQAAAGGFTQYAYAFIQQEADEVEPRDLAKAGELRTRARKLYLRARDYGLRGLEVKHPGLGGFLRQDPKASVRKTARSDVALLYWTAAAWGSAISLSKDNPDLVADQPVVEALVDRAAELDPAFDHGAIHAFLITYEQSRKGVPGDPHERSRMHFQKAVELSRGQLASPLVALAESVSVARQDRKEFESLLQCALAIDPDARPEFRLSNLVMQRRARWLLGRTDELFLE